MNHSLIEKTATDNKQLVIGLDFGAAFSKVVIGDKRVKYAVPFAEFARVSKGELITDSEATTGV